MGGDTRRMLGIREPMAPGANSLARSEQVDTSGWSASAAGRRSGRGLTSCSQQVPSRLATATSS
ncbi:hypothetical protein FHR71_005601 [Methylobacterium sp. RAS18]|nr:hypothetical protein [Methylobacterium sp. RAS18]